MLKSTFKTGLIILFFSPDDVLGPPHLPGGGAGVQPSREHPGEGQMMGGDKCKNAFFLL